MAVTYSTATSAYVEAGTSRSWSYTSSSGADRVLYVALDFDAAVTGITVTYAGDALTAIATANRRAYLYRRIAPATGANTLAIAWTTATNMVATAITVDGADQTTPNDTPLESNGTAKVCSQAVTTSSAAGQLVLDFVGRNAGGNADVMTPGAGDSQTQRAYEYTAAAGGCVSAASTSSATTTATPDWAWTNNESFGYVAVNVLPVSAITTASTSEAITVTDAAEQLVTLILTSASTADSVTVTDYATQLLTTLYINASASESVTVSDVAAELVTALVSAWEDVTVSDISDVAASILAALLTTWDDVVVTDAATQAVGILAAAAEHSGTDTLTSSNW